MINVEIETYSDKYRQPVIDLILPIQREEFGVQIDLDGQPDLKDIPGFYQKGNGNFWVATVDGIVAGTVGLLDFGNHCVALRKMFVQVNYRGGNFGVGQALLNTVFEWAEEKKLTTILLGTTEKFLAAQRFYEKNGFKEVAVQELPEEFPRMKVDNKFYKYDMRH